MSKLLKNNSTATESIKVSRLFDVHWKTVYFNILFIENWFLLLYSINNLFCSHYLLIFILPLFLVNSRQYASIPNILTFYFPHNKSYVMWVGLRESDWLWTTMHGLLVLNQQLNHYNIPFGSLRQMTGHWKS